MSKSTKEKLKMRLYIAGDGTNSKVAQENLRQLCELHPERKHEVETIDVSKKPDIALKNNVFITPTLHILDPKPGTMIHGTLTDKSALKPFFPKCEE